MGFKGELFGWIFCWGVGWFGKDIVFVKFSDFNKCWNVSEIGVYSKIIWFDFNDDGKNSWVEDK